MICDNLTPEICQVLTSSMNSIFYRIGLLCALIILLVMVVSYFISKKLFQNMFDKNIEKYKDELEKSRTKNIELWVYQKDLTFEFIEFLEKRLFNNPVLKNRKLKESDPEFQEELKKVLEEFNIYYGKLYLILDTPIIKEINKLMDQIVGPIKRYYLYREIRKQLQKLLNKDDECSYLSIDVDKADYLEGVSKAKSFDELKRIYPFIEPGDSENTFKALPFFSPPSFYLKEKK